MTYLWIFVTSVIIAGIIYCCKSNNRVEKKVIQIWWSRDKQKRLPNKLDLFPFKTLLCYTHETAQFRYDYETYGKLCRWRDKKYIDNIHISSVVQLRDRTKFDPQRIL